VLFTPIFFSVLMKLFGGKSGPDRGGRVHRSIDEEQVVEVEK